MAHVPSDLDPTPDRGLKHTLAMLAAAPDPEKTPAPEPKQAQAVAKKAAKQ